MRETEVDISFHFSCFCMLFETNVAKDKQEFSQYDSCAEFVARCGKMQCAAQNNLKGHYASHGCDGGLTLRFTF